MKRIKLELKNAFGGSYIINALPRKKVEQIINDIKWEEVIKTAWDKHIDDYGRTEVRLDVTTGQFIYANYTQNSGSIESHFIILYVISENTLGNISFQYEGDILSAEEYAECQKLIKSGDASNIEQAMDKLKIDFNNRFKDFLIWCWHEGDKDEAMRNIGEQIDYIYGEKILCC